MADLKISQLPTASSLANTDLLPIKTTAGTKAITFEDLKGSQEGYFKRVIDEYMEFDYEDLKALRTDGELIAGQKYLLTDYQTVYQQDRGGTYEDKVSDVEPLILTAVSTNEFSQVAYSPSYPQDIIWYNFDNVLSPENTTLFYNSVDRISKGFKGIIIRRIDTQKNIDYSYDWRTMLWWRNVISGIIPEAGEYLTFRDLSNVYNVVSGNSCYNNTFGNYCSGNTFGNYCSGNTFGDSCYNNTFGNSCSYSTFGDYCYNNTFGSYCYNNTFGNGCSDNTFGGDCYNNTFGNGCFDNTFGESCYNNTFGIGLRCADVKNDFSDATVTNPAIYNKNYNHTFYVDSSGNKKCYCITNGEMTDVPLEV
jgi:hypothetical protein